MSQLKKATIIGGFFYTYILVLCKPIQSTIFGSMKKTEVQKVSEALVNAGKKIKAAKPAIDEMAKALEGFKHIHMQNFPARFLTFLLLCTSFTFQAQDTYKANDLDSITARQFANTIVASAKTQYEFLKLKKRAKRQTLTYYYIDASLSPEEKAEQKEMGCRDCMKINFKTYTVGANADMQEPGASKIKFINVSGSFLDLFPTWQREFLQTATKENVLNYKDRAVKKDGFSLFRFSKINGIWEIRNNS